MNNYEDLIRDHLAENLGILNPEYELIGKEHYIPKGLTTKSFIDILAKDRDNNYIIIEVKRSKQAERQAIHEIYKYVEAIKNKYKANASEIKAIIVSTSWEELLVPFSAFVNETNITVEGFHLEVDTEFKVISATKVIPCKTNKGRLFSPMHKCNLYNDRINLEKGLKDHHKKFKLKGFEDYVLFVLKAPESDDSDYKKRLAQMAAQLIGSEPDYAFFGNIILPKFMIYSAFHRLSRERYHEILKRDTDLYEETVDYIELAEITDPEAIDEVLERNILGSLKPYFYSDEADSGYPAKLVKILEDENWEILQIIKSDSLNQNSLLSNNKILSEMVGNTGIANTILKDSFTIGDKAKFVQMQENSVNALKHNEVWKNHLKIFFESIQSLEGYTLEIEILNTSHILLSIILIVISEKRSEHLPKYMVRVSKGSDGKVFLGTFKWNGKTPDLKSILDRYFSGKPGDLIMTLNWGGFDRNNDAVLEELGLSFESYVVEITAGQKQDFWFKNFKYEKIEFIEDGLGIFTRENKDFVDQLVAIYEKHRFEVKK